MALLRNDWIRSWVRCDCVLLLEETVMANEKHPCDLCKKDRIECYQCSLSVYPRKYECDNDDCFLNHDGSCLLGFYEECGAWEVAEDGK